MVCPSGEELLAFHLGELAEPQILSVGEHLTACPRCEQQARQLDGLSDTVLSALRGSGAMGPAMLPTAPRAAYPMLPAPTGPAPEVPAYEMLGPYKLLEQIGEGGVGTVSATKKNGDPIAVPVAPCGLRVLPYRFGTITAFGTVAVAARGSDITSCKMRVGSSKRGSRLRKPRSTV